MSPREKLVGNMNEKCSAQFCSHAFLSVSDSETQRVELQLILKSQGTDSEIESWPGMCTLLRLFVDADW